MKIPCHTKRSIWLGVILCLFLTTSGYAQKRKSRAERKVREATYYFTEGVKYYILEDMEKALALFEKSLESDPNNDAAHFKIADILSRQGVLDQALYHANQSIELSPDNKYYYLTKAEVLTQQSNFEEAALVYETMIDRIDNTEDYLFDLAALYLYQQRYDQAIEAYDRIEQRYGILPEVVTAKQRIYLQQNKLDMALAEAERLIEAFPGEGSYVIELAEIYISNGKDEEAIPYLEELLDIAPDNPEAELLLAKIYQNTGDDAQAQSHMGAAFTSPNLDLRLKLELVAKYIQELPNPSTQELVRTLTDNILASHPDEAEAYILKGDFLNAIDSASEARNYYLRSTRYDDSNFDVWQNLLTIEFQTLQETDSVIKHSEQALEMFPNQGIVYFYNGAAHAAEQNFDEAAYSLDQAKRLSNNEELTLYCNIYLGDVYNGLEEYDKSAEAYEEVLKADPSNDYVLNNYSYFLAQRQENLPYAKQLSTRLLELNPENANYLDTHGWVLYMMGEYKQARKYIEQALEQGSASGEVVEHYGDILFKLGDVDQAVQQWMKAKGMNDASELIDKKIADRKLYE